MWLPCLKRRQPILINAELTLEQWDYLINWAEEAAAAGFDHDLESIVSKLKEQLD
jgi:hypothetical protein